MIYTLVDVDIAANSSFQSSGGKEGRQAGVGVGGGGGEQFTITS